MIGHIIGIGLAKKINFPVEFNKTVYKLLLNQTITIEDLLNENPNLKRKLDQIEELSINNDYMVFTADYVTVENGEFKMVNRELCDQGKDILLTKKNFEIYKCLYLERELNRLKIVINCFRVGILHMIDEEIFNSIKYALVLKKIIFGNRIIDIKDWQDNTVYSECTKDDDTIKWFWDFVEDCKSTKNKLNMLLMSLIGLYNPPIGGFANLPNHQFKIHLDRTAKKNKLHISMCINEVEFGIFDSREILYDMLENSILAMQSENIFDYY